MSTDSRMSMDQFLSHYFNNTDLPVNEIEDLFLVKYPGNEYFFFSFLNDYCS